MLKKIMFFICCSVGVIINDAMAITVKKAASVSAQQADKNESALSLVPTVMGIYSGVQQLTQQNKALTEACVPSSSEMATVDNLMKEWAKTNPVNEEGVKTKMNPRDPCGKYDTYEMMSQREAGTERTDVCYNAFSGNYDKGKVWNGFPKVGKASYCADGEDSCKNKITTSDIYQIYELIDFSDADLTASELSAITKLKEKAETCSGANLAKKKSELATNFIGSTIGNMGAKTNSSNIMQSVSGIVGSSAGGVSGTLGSLGGIATQFLQKE